MEIIWHSFHNRPQTKFAKVIFLHLSVSHSVHREVCVKVQAQGEGWGSGQGSVQAHTWRCPDPHPGVETHTKGSRPTPRGPDQNPGVQTHTQGGVQAQARGWITACSQADTSPADGYCCGRYASYPNAFLLIYIPTDEIIRVFPK